MSGPNTRSRAQRDEGSPPPRPTPAVDHEEALPPPPPPTLVDVLLQMERNRMDQNRFLEALARNTSLAPAATGGEIGRAHV